MNVDEALKARISVRAFKPDPVPQALVRDVLDAARWSPSGSNMQPWKIIAVTGAARDAARDATLQALGRGASAEEMGGYGFNPDPLDGVYQQRHSDYGAAYYKILGVDRADQAARMAQVMRNFDFFGAPVGLFIVLDHSFSHGQWAHIGMFMQSIALAAVERGLGTCMQEAFASARKSLGAHFGLPDNEFIYCAMALGYPDETAPVNNPERHRIPVEEFTRFEGF